MKRWLPFIINLILFDALWTLAVVGASRAWWWLAPVLILVSAAVQFRWSPRPRSDALLILAGAIVGVSLDAASCAIPLFRSASPSTVQFVILFACHWINFGTTLRPGFRWLWGRPVLAAIFGGIGGPAAFWAAARLGAISFVDPSWRALLWCGGEFALMLALWTSAAHAAERRTSFPRLPT